MAGINGVMISDLENVVGGTQNIVNNTHKGYSYANCRKEPSLSSPVFFKIPNGTEVYPTGRTVNHDGFKWYEINLAGSYDYGWIAGHLIGY